MATIIGTSLNDLMVATSAKAVGASRCSALLAGLDCSTHRAWKTPAASEPSSGTAQIAVFHAGGLASTRSNPRTSVGNIEANVTASGAPERVADDDVRARLASRLRAACGGRRLASRRSAWLVARRLHRYRSGRRNTRGWSGQRSVRPRPNCRVLAAEPGDQHHCRRAGTVTMHVKSGAVHRNEFVDQGGGSCDGCRRDRGGGRVRGGVRRGATVVDDPMVVVGSWMRSRGATVVAETVVVDGLWAVPRGAPLVESPQPASVDRDAQGGGDCNDDVLVFISACLSGDGCSGADGIDDVADRLC